MVAEKPILYPILVGALALALAGCLPGSDHPLPSQGDITQISEGFLGEWIMSEFLGRSDDIAYLSLEVSLQGTKHLQTVLDDSEKTSVSYCTLHQFGNDFVVCQDMDSEIRDRSEIYRVELSGANDSVLKVFPMNTALLEEVIEEEVIAGTISELIPPKSIRITDTSSNLEAYVTSSPEVFDATPIMVFTKQ